MSEETALDAYDDAIAYLTEHPEEITNAWGRPSCHKAAGCLFGFTSQDRRMPLTVSPPCPLPDLTCGCLTQVRAWSSRGVPGRLDLTQLIRADDRIPKDSSFITVADLPVFAEWNRRLDRELGRRPPVRLVSAST